MISLSRQQSLRLAALGVVFGDIGTSPIYTIKTAFSASTGLLPQLPTVLGILSLIFWLLVIVISLKYVYFVLKADNHGEGGILSLAALVARTTGNFVQRRIVLILALIGAGLFYGDSVITPAISVLSAVEGLSVPFPHLHSLVIPITLIIIVLLFLFQKHGTATVGAWFGPIMIVWFLVLGGLGITTIVQYPIVLSAINPVHAFTLLSTHPAALLPILGAVMLCITGGEAIYADMGHFGAQAIRAAWHWVALPGLLLNYFGQGALLLADPASVRDPFYLLAPVWLQVPLVVLTTIATVIASQATISGAYSITRQAIQLGYLPRMKILHTSSDEIGQIYIPTINWMMLAGVIFMVVDFRSSDALASAYGISVLGVMLITTLLITRIMAARWKWKPHAWVMFLVVFGLIDLLLWSGAITKFADGGYVTVTIAIMIFTVMITWVDGTRFLQKSLTQLTGSLKSWMDKIALQSIRRAEGTAIYLVRSSGDTPLALLRNTQFNHILHERIITLHIKSSDDAYVHHSQRYQLKSLGENIWSIEATYGFMEIPSIPKLLKQCVDDAVLDISLANTTFFVSRLTLRPDAHLGLPLSQAYLYAFLYVNQQQVHQSYGIPFNRVVEIGAQMRI